MSVQCRGRGWRSVQAGMAGLCAAVLTAWLLQHLAVAGAGALVQAGVSAPPAVRLAAWLMGDTIAAATAAAIAGAMAAALAWCLLPRAAVTLRWDGQVWSADGQAVVLLLAIDFGGAVVLRWQPEGGTRWAWTAASRRDAGTGWHALRTALHAHATRAATQDGSAWR